MLGPRPFILSRLFAVFLALLDQKVPITADLYTQVRASISVLFAFSLQLSRVICSATRLTIVRYCCRM